MKFLNVKRTWNIKEKFKKHICPQCQSKMIFVKCSRIVDLKSDDVNDFDWFQSGGDGYMIGKTKFIWDELKCINCDLQVTINEYNNQTK